MFGVNQENQEAGKFRILLCELSGGSLVFMAKILEREGSISPSSFYRQLPDCQSHIFSFIYPVDEFSCKGVKTWSQSNISSYCIAFGANLQIIGLMVVILMSYSHVVSVLFVLWGVSPILRNESNQGQKVCGIAPGR